MEGAPLDSKLKQSETQRNTSEDQTSLIPAHCIKFGGESKNNQKYQLVVSTPSLGLTGLGLGMVESNVSLKSPIETTLDDRGNQQQAVLQLQQIPNNSEESPSMLLLQDVKPRRQNELRSK